MVSKLFLKLLQEDFKDMLSTHQFLNGSYVVPEIASRTFKNISGTVQFLKCSLFVLANTLRAV